jgi:hypothetical protein
MQRLQLLTILIGALVAASALAGAAEERPLTGDSVVRFASAAEGAAAITAKDEFVAALSRFDLQCRMQSGGPATVEAWQKFAAGEVRGWEADQMAAVGRSLDRLRPGLEKLNLPLPGTVLLVHTTGREEFEAAYTRGSAIVLPDKVLRYQPAQLDRLIAHELFHVLSRYNPMLRSELYAIIGFTAFPPLALPPSLADRKITNPDAPLVDCYIEIADAGRTYVGAPVLYATPKEYDPRAGLTLFKYLTFRLMVIKKQSGGWEPVMKGDQAVVIDPKALPAYFDQVGRNTEYVIHPDEILADNFVHLVQGNKNLMTPRVVERMAKVLAK